MYTACLGSWYARYNTCCGGGLCGYNQRHIGTSDTHLNLWTPASGISSLYTNYMYICSYGSYNLHYDLVIEVLMKCICKIYT